MALFKVSRGNSTTLPATLTDGWAYFCTDTGEFFIDYADAEGNLFRKQINADEAKKLAGYDIANAINDSVVEIPTSKAVMDAISVFDDRIVATDDGELTNVLPDMFGGHTPDEYMLKAEMPEVEKSDWSVNDENDAAYIKNRTHWTDDDGTVHKIDEKYLPDVGVRSWNDLTDKPFDTTTTRIVDNYTLDNPSVDMSVLSSTEEPNHYQLTISDGFSVGDTVVVTWNGQKYSCKAYALDGVAAVGNSMYMGGGDTGEPFLIGCMTPMLVVITFDTGAVVSIDIEETKKMSGKYVEGMGWSEGFETVFPKQIISNYKNSELGGYYSQIDNVGVVLEIGKTYRVTVDNAVFEGVAQADYSNYVYFGSDSMEVSLIYMPTSDRLLVNSDDNTPRQLTIETNNEIIHPIDPKYLPTGGFGYSETVALLKASNAEEYEHPDFGKAWLIENAPELTVGETYTVVYNGAEYNCVCQPAPEGLSQDTEAVAMGNFFVAGGENTGEPFAMMISCMFNRVDVIDLSGASAVKVAIEKEKINTIDKKYLPIATYYVMWSDDKGSYILYKDKNCTEGTTIDDFDSVLSAKAFRQDDEFLAFGGAFFGAKGGFGLNLFIVNGDNSVVYRETLSSDFVAGGPM